MTINSEQIQALKAAAIAVGRDGRTDDEWFHYLQCVHYKFILSLLAEREADKALISESVVLFETLSQRIAELEQRHCGGALMEREQHHVGVVNKLLERITELEARTLTVKLPEPFYPDGDIDCPLVVELDDVKSACAAAGITLVVGE